MQRLLKIESAARASLSAWRLMVDMGEGTASVIERIEELESALTNPGESDE